MERARAYSRRASLRDSFVKILSRRSLVPRRLNRLKGVYLFHSIVRRVMEYIDWLIEEPAVEEISDDVAINIRISQEKKIEKKTLTIEDRSVLLTRTEDRSSEDRKYLYELFKRFHIFTNYPDELRETVAGACFYQYLGPGRVIVRQNRQAENLYYIINGEVSVTREVVDRWTGESQEVDMGTLTAGDIFGQVAMLHRIPRTATVVSKTKVDLILICCRDFDDILRRHLQREWNVLEDALINFNYFKCWSVEAIRECCILSRIKEYQSDEVLLGDGKGMVNYVHFLLEGECRLIEHMVVREKRTVYGVNYELYDPGKASVHKERLSKSSDTDSKLDELEYEYRATKTSDVNVTQSEHMVDYAQLVLSSKAADMKIDFERQSIITTALLDVINEWHKITDVAEMLMREPSSISQQRYPIDVRTIFMQICTFNRGACFGLGEDMTNRRIISITPVKCFLVPRYWLNIHNRANIWERVKLFMNSKFPTKEKLFAEFVRNRRWLEYKKSLIQDVGRRGRRPHSNVTIHDVPYAIRIVNDMAIET